MILDISHSYFFYCAWGHTSGEAQCWGLPTCEAGNQQAFQFQGAPQSRTHPTLDHWGTPMNLAYAPVGMDGSSGTVPAGSPLLPDLLDPSTRGSSLHLCHRSCVISPEAFHLVTWETPRLLITCDTCQMSPCWEFMLLLIPLSPFMEVLSGTWCPFPSAPTLREDKFIAHNLESLNWQKWVLPSSPFYPLLSKTWPGIKWPKEEAELVCTYPT